MITTTLKVSDVKRFESRTPISGRISQAEKKNQEYGGEKKNNLSKFLDYHQKLVKEKGLPESKLFSSILPKQQYPSCPDARAKEC